jgi:hypothetical protein
LGRISVSRCQPSDALLGARAGEGVPDAELAGCGGAVLEAALAVLHPVMRAICPMVLG